MFGNPLWSLLKGPLKKILADKFSVLGGRFKAVLSSTENDLVSIMKEQFSVPGFASGFYSVEVRKGDERIGFDLFPIEALKKSSTLTDKLAVKLKGNIDLGAARNDAGITDDDWDNMIRDYSGAVLELGLSSAVERAVDEENVFALGYYIIDVAKKEALRVIKNGGAQNLSFDLIVLYRPVGIKPPSVSTAKKFWSKRRDKGYQYQRNPDGYAEFKVP